MRRRPPGIQPAALWGTEDRLRELFGDGVSELDTDRARVKFRYRSPEHWLEYFRTYFGPMITAFERVGEEGAPALEDDLLELMRDQQYRAGDAALVAPAEYVEVVAVRRLIRPSRRQRDRPLGPARGHG